MATRRKGILGRPVAPSCGLGAEQVVVLFDRVTLSPCLPLKCKAKAATVYEVGRLLANTASRVMLIDHLNQRFVKDVHDFRLNDGKNSQNLNSNGLILKGLLLNRYQHKSSIHAGSMAPAGPTPHAVHSQACNVWPLGNL